MHILHLYIVGVHSCSLLPNEDVIYVNQNVPIQGQSELLSRQERDGIYENQLVQPKIQVIAEKDSLNPIVESQVVNYRGIESTYSSRW